MTQGGDSSSSDREAPEKKGLNLDLLSRPVITILLSAGTIYLYRLRDSDLNALKTLPEEEPITRIRAFLPHIASRIEAKGFRDERPPLATEDVNRLSDAEVEHVAEIYAEILLRRPQLYDDEGTKPERGPNEPAVSFLDRLLKHEAQVHSQQIRKVHEKMLVSTSSIFDQVRKSSSVLGSTLSAFDRLAKSPHAAEIRLPDMDHFRVLDEQFARQRRERAEELEMVRLTGKMTAESARTLKDLAEAATVLLEQLDERDKKADHSTRKQITVAVWSVGISAALAFVALIISGFAYFQDKANNDSEDKWQSELIAVIREGNQKMATAEEESQQLRNKLTEIEAKLSSFESAQTPVLSSKSADSAANSETKPGSTIHSP